MQEERGCTWRIVTLGTGHVAELRARQLDSNPIKVRVACGICFSFDQTMFGGQKAEMHQN